MKTKIVRAVIALAVVAGFAGGLIAGRVTADQPRMQMALENLTRAQNNLENASDDKGGHRAKAISLIKDAKEEVKKGINYDRDH